MKAYAIFFKSDEKLEFETITLDFEKWFKEENKRRKEEGTDAYFKEDFKVYESEVEE